MNISSTKKSMQVARFAEYNAKQIRTSIRAADAPHAETLRSSLRPKIPGSLEG